MLFYNAVPAVFTPATPCPKPSTHRNLLSESACHFSSRVRIHCWKKGGMAMDHPLPALPHKLTLSGRSSLSMTGVTEVVSFDDAAVVLRTQLGTLVVQGSGLQLKTLASEGGQVAVEGKVTSLVYEEPREKGGWLSRLFG